MVSIIAVSSWSHYEVHANANKELTLLVDMVNSIRAYIAEDVRPEMLSQDIFHPPVVSSTVATKHVANHFLKLQPGYYIKTASDNPLNQDNLPEPLEQKLLEQFRADSSSDGLIEEGQIGGKTFLVSSRPSVSKASCLRCHASPSAAPETIRQQYGGESGYGYIENQVVGVSLVGVPLGNIYKLIVQRSVTVIVVLTLLFTAVFIVISRQVQGSILKPIIYITQVVRDISRGNLAREVSVQQRDEIGELANAFELMRRSLLTATKRIRKQAD
ncbi:MAG: DUF3365 domain-containing protein [Cyanobacteria bacterium P01_F01_bin.86]